MNTQNIITLDGLTKTYGDKTVVSNINLSIAEGEVFGFLGHNGAGKTTTINMLTTLLEPTSGTATIGGYDLRTESFKIKKLIGYVPEQVQLYGTLSAYENLEYFAKLSGIPETERLIKEMAAFVHIEEYLHQRVGTLSKGMRQRVGLAQAILHDPKVLFLDEPTSGLDPIGVKELRDIIQKLNQERGMTVFMNTHLLSEVSKTCTSIGILNHGNLMYSGSLEDATHTFKNEAALEEMYVITQHHVTA